MRELTDDLIKRVCHDYGMQVGQTSVGGSLESMRAVMEWARDEARAETVREHLFKQQQETYGGKA